jgi:integrase
MAPKFSYLTKSPKGMYEYRRRVPSEYRAYFPRTSSGQLKAEWKQSLRTDDMATARKRWFVENEAFESALKLAKLLSSPPDAPSIDEQITLATELVRNHGLLPTQAPSLGPDATEEDFVRFKTEAAEWNEKIFNARQQLIDAQDDLTTDYSQMQRDYEDGTWGRRDYVTPRKPMPASALHLEKALAVIDGRVDASTEPVWQDAVELYIATNKRKTLREPEKARRWEVKTRGLLEKFGHALGGMNAKLSELDRGEIVAYLWRTYPSTPTRNRYNNTLSAVINCWNSEHKEQIFNPFRGLSNKMAEHEEAAKRRSFRPEEWFEFEKLIDMLANQELRTIALLILYTGCRNSEAAGIQRRDLKLDEEVPHVIYRTNTIRRMAKGGLERAVPLMPKVIEAFRSFKLPNTPHAPVFEKYGNTKGFDSVSVALRNVIRDDLRVSDEGLVPHSARHTVIDRATAARVSTDHAQYLVGHKSSGSSAIHRRYGTMTPPRVLLDDMVRIFEVTKWGYYEE